MLDRLETRRVLHSSVVENGVLTIFGSVLDDTYQFATSRTGFTFFPADGGVSETPETYSFAEVSRLEIFTDRGADVVILGRLPIPALLDGGRGNDTLSGGFGADTLLGKGGADVLFGNDGRDLLDGGSEGDDMAGGAQRDTLTYADRVLDLEVGLGLLADDGEVGEGDNARTDIEVVIGGSGNDFIRTTSGRSVAFFGGAGNDTLIGGSGEDYFDGGDGIDEMFGQGNADFFAARDGLADVIDGGGGLDDGLFDDGVDVLTNVP
jgi:hypothetical protein